MDIFATGALVAWGTVTAIGFSGWASVSRANREIEQDLADAEDELVEAKWELKLANEALAGKTELCRFLTQGQMERDKQLKAKSDEVEEVDALRSYLTGRTKTQRGLISSLFTYCVLLREQNRKLTKENRELADMGACAAMDAIADGALDEPRRDEELSSLFPDSEMNEMYNHRRAELN